MRTHCYAFSNILLPFFFFIEQDTIGVSFDQADYTVAEGMELTVTGRLTGLVGQVQTTFSVNLNIGFDIDPLTG